MKNLMGTTFTALLAATALAVAHPGGGGGFHGGGGGFHGGGGGFHGGGGGFRGGFHGGGGGFHGGFHSGFGGGFRSRFGGGFHRGFRGGFGGGFHGNRFGAVGFPRPNAGRFGGFGLGFNHGFGNFNRGGWNGGWGGTWPWFSTSFVYGGGYPGYAYGYPYGYLGFYDLSPIDMSIDYPDLPTYPPYGPSYYPSPYPTIIPDGGPPALAPVAPVAPEEAPAPVGKAVKGHIVSLTDNSIALSHGGRVDSYRITPSTEVSQVLVKGNLVQVFLQPGTAAVQAIVKYSPVYQSVPSSPAVPLRGQP
ncbi:MAG TPA: hypothetical protein VGO93_14090 [Candidatus Xenobia bacterium]|jgi:hypothetical protein